MNPADFSLYASVFIIILVVGAVIRRTSVAGNPREKPPDDKSGRKFGRPPSAAPGFTSKYPTGADIEYTIQVMDNYGSGSYKHRAYNVYEDAVEECKRIVEEFFDKASPNETVAQIMRNFSQYGESPWIVPKPEGGDFFDAKAYAKERAKSISKVSVPFVRATFTTTKYPKGPGIKYTIHVKKNNGSDNFHSYKHRDYDVYEDAVEECKSIVEDSLCDYSPDLTADFIIRMYDMSGETPWIEPKPEGDDFDALEYVKERAKSISRVPEKH